MKYALAAALSCVLVACANTGAGDTDTDSPSGAESGSTTMTATSGPITGGATSQASSGTTGPGTTGAGSTDTTGGESSGSETTGPGGPVPELPTPDGACPKFVDGTLEFTPAETETRRARVYFDPATGGGGPLVFWFHGTGSSPDGSANAITNAARDEIVAMGGMVVMPWNDPDTGQFPWFLVDEQREDDLHLMDEIVGCAAAGPGINARRIHAAGFSAGGMHVSQAAFRRASYLASTVSLSGGLVGGNAPTDAPDQFIAAMIVHGGADDDVGGFNFMEASGRLRDAVDARGGFSLECDHGGGHSYSVVREHIWPFMQAHPFGADPSPFEAGLPDWVPAFCEP